MPEVTEERKHFVESAGRVSVPRKRLFNRFDLILLALCCLSFLIYLIESESIRYLVLHVVARR
jgi:hypothetical protein